ncbi:AAA family ATPase [Photobacterium phosphoreum]|uniref:AAA family ATPase n=1 Tax=Photobacterium phosphoreum TaxID=659 RepID=UPI0039AF5568
MKIEFIKFIGPDKETASVFFGSGLNIIYGPSNTGKSSIVDAIDFMFGRESRLKKKSEHEGYEKILLGISFSDNDKFTLIRSIQGGDIECINSLDFPISMDANVEILKLKKATKKHRTISSFLFEKLNIEDKKLKKNKRNELSSLTIRNSIKLSLITEVEIQKESSPYFHQGYIKETEELSRLKLFLTGNDDSYLLPEEKEKVIVSRTAKVDLLNELINEIQEEIDLNFNEYKSVDELKSQSEKLSISIEKKLLCLENNEELLSKNNEDRNVILKELNGNESRLNEVQTMISRFNLLGKQYLSDISRLENISEVGTLFIALPNDGCPLCGVLPSNYNKYISCDIDMLVESAISECEKLQAISKELSFTLSNLNIEIESLSKIDKSLREDLGNCNSKMKDLNDIFNKDKNSYRKYIDTNDFINKGIRIYEQKEVLEDRLSSILKTKKPQNSTIDSETILPIDELSKLSSVIKDILDAWEFIMPSNVYFDSETKDFVFDGIHRESNGKGFRSLTHAACSLGLMEYQEKYHKFSHYGFVLLDSPLLAYEEPDDEKDDLSETDININFFNYLSKLKDKQVIVIENKKSIPKEFSEGEQITVFTKSNIGRYGFFPIIKK